MEYIDKNYTEDLKIANWVFNRYFKNFICLKDDMVQTAVIKLWQNRPNYSKAKGTYATFACLCAYREMLAFLRKEKRHTGGFSLYEEIDDGLFLIDILGVNDDGIIELAEFEVLLSKIKVVIFGLDAKGKEVIELFLKHYPQKEIAGRVGTSQGIVFRYIKAFRESLKTELTKD